MESTFLEIIKLIVAGIAGGGLTQVFVAWTRKDVISAEARGLVAKTDLMEQRLRLQLTTEMSSLRKELRAAQQQIASQAVEIIDLKRRLSECEQQRQR